MMAQGAPTDARTPFEVETGDQHTSQNRNSLSHAIVGSFVLGMMVATIGLLTVQHCALGDASLTKFFGAPATPGKMVTPVSITRKNPAALRTLAARAGARAGCQRSRVCMMATGLFYGTTTGNTETVAGYIGEASGLEPQDIGDISPADLAAYDGLIVGAPTWHTGADTERSGTAWDDILEEVKGMDLGGKPVAVFGCGDAAGYADNFCDAIEEIYSTFKATGAKMVGSVDASGYTFEDSKSVQDGKFLGLPFDEDNEADLSEERAKKWVDQLKTEGMPLD
jgi:flavodoxin I